MSLFLNPPLFKFDMATTEDMAMIADVNGFLVDSSSGSSSKSMHPNVQDPLGEARPSPTSGVFSLRAYCCFRLSCGCVFQDADPTPDTNVS